MVDEMEMEMEGCVREGQWVGNAPSVDFRMWSYEAS